MDRHWNGQSENHPTIVGARLSTFSTGVRNAFDRSSKLFMPFPSGLVDARANAIPANRGWLFDSLAYQGFAPQFADGFSYFVNRNTFDHDTYRANLGRGLKGTKPELPETLDFEYRKRPLDAAHVEGIIIPIGETFKVRYSNAWGPGIHREIFFGWQRFADEVVIDSNTGVDQSFRFDINTTGFDWFNGKGPGRRRWGRSTTQEFQGGFELQHLGSGKLSYIRPDSVALRNGSSVPVTIRLVGSLAGARGLVKLLPASVQAQAVYPIRIGTVESFFSGAGDGYVTFGDPDWPTTVNAAVGTGSGTTFTQNAIEASAGFTITRIATPFDSSALPDNTIISSALYKVYYNGGSGSVSSAIYGGFTAQTSPTTLTNNDYANIRVTGIITGPAIGGLPLGYVTLTIPSGSFGSISKTSFTKLGVNHSFEGGGAPAGTNQITIVLSEDSFGGPTARDPILEVTHTVPSAAALFMASD